MTHRTSLDPALAKVPFPTPATYEAIFRHYLDISMTCSRQLLSGLSKFAPSDRARQALERLGNDKEAYHNEVAERCLKLGEVLMIAAGDDIGQDTAAADFKVTKWDVPFDRIISAVPRLQPRFYSISSSPKLHPNHVHITVRLAPPCSVEGLVADRWALGRRWCSSTARAKRTCTGAGPTTS